MAKKGITIHKPQSREEFNKLNNELTRRGFVAIDALKPGIVHDVTIAGKDPSLSSADQMAACIGSGEWSNGPLSKVAWSFDARDDTVENVSDKDGKVLGQGYVKWGANNSIPSTIPVLAQASPYTAAPLRYIADLTTGLGPKLIYRFPDGFTCDYKDAGDLLLAIVDDLEKEENVSSSTLTDENNNPMRNIDIERSSRHQNSKLLQRLRADYDIWKRTWEGYNETDENGDTRHVQGAKDFLEENNIDLHFIQCEQDDVMFDMYFPTIGFSDRGRKGRWNPYITKVDILPAHSTRLEKMNDSRRISHAYFSDKWRTLGSVTTHTATNTNQQVVMYNAAMPQHLLQDLRNIVSSNQKTRAAVRPMWVVCPTYYPSLNKPYYPQPAWWSIFTSKAYDFSSTILYDKAKQRENKTSWGRIFYISLDYLDQVFADEGYQGNPEKQQEFIDQLEASMEQFLQHRENHGKMMRQWMWQGQDGKDHHNVEIVDIADAKHDETAAGETELQLSTSPIFLALQVDPRLVGVPMVKASNGGTALREMALIKQLGLATKQRLYLNFLNSIARFNEWDEHAVFIIRQQTFTTLDRSHTGIVETTSGEEA